MTTTVIIQSPRPNHLRVKVVQGYGDKGKFVPISNEEWATTILGEGESTVVYVHDGMAFLITEEPLP